MKCNQNPGPSDECQVRKYEDKPTASICTLLSKITKGAARFNVLMGWTIDIRSRYAFATNELRRFLGICDGLIFQ
jgi:hypothetical protein